MSAQFSLVTAFSNAVDGGNPAAVVFIDMTTPVDTFKQIATNFNEPITCFVSATPLPSNAQKTVAFNVRWFTVNKSETPLCGHGTLAAAKAVFDKDDVPKDTELIEFHTLTRGVMKARRLLGGFIEIELPSGKTVDVSAEEHARNSRLVNRAIGKEVAIDRILAGVDAFESYLLFVLDEKENLENLSINATPLVSIH
ncbi:putative epimerase, PhzC PhzF homolog [Lyophyllum shimeji]|uniref:Epimerase, PhzC PhzF homolog n=1 Tax=Lyophyllum shimeji TaxID=47721 RepID=A0A9P3USE0_LYOSH|nr:putative epimerase, PhzC PhzF homolog [Lyophyllum shimeji]